MDDKLIRGIARGNEDLARELYRSRIKDRIAHFVTLACLVSLVITFGAVMFYLGRISVEVRPARLTGIHRLA